MTTRVDTPQTSCVLGFARADVTPPVGIYHRMWGAALHDRATGVHRPLAATALWLGSGDRRNQRVVLGLDHCLLDREEFARVRALVGEAVSIPPESVFVAMSHTHGSAWMSRSRAHLPGGDLIGPYLDAMGETCARAAKEAADRSQPATLVYGTARCDLARHRDFRDAATGQFVCGFNPDGVADDTVLVAKAVADESGKTLGTVVNYACHPTTLAWENTLISPDYVGAMREVVERETGAPCLFLQGASGDLGPKEGYVGDAAVADRNGRQLGFAALSGLEALPPPGTHFEYAGPVVSGAVLGTWKHRPTDRDFTAWQTRDFTANLPYRLELPTEADTRAELAHWEAEGARARAADDSARAGECRAKAEQMTRQLARLAALPAGKSYPLPVSVVRLGGAVWVFTAGELYQYFQVTLRRRFPDFAVVVATLTNDWQPGYLPAASSYGYGIYQDVIAAVGPGALEALTETVCREVEQLVK
ncbi:MAG TPA: neutral/alkaline non-lysosomal ceramidase N-terminal domain-containing protein [Gemmata sp.]|nr:neutral/alkaline non-lysosomal ceramidase N-terminal domain-containing protein [Gemmata sp.]